MIFYTVITGYINTIVKEIFMETLKKQIYDVIKMPHLSNFATITEDGKPWTRYVMAVGAEDLTIRFSSYTDARKVKQIKNNSEVHLTCGAESTKDMKPYLQIQGIATYETSEAERHAFWNPALEGHFDGPDDPRYAVVVVKPYRIEYSAPMTSEEVGVWEK